MSMQHSGVGKQRRWGDARTLLSVRVVMNMYLVAKIAHRHLTLGKLRIWDPNKNYRDL